MSFNLTRDAWVPVRLAVDTVQWVAPADIPGLGDEDFDIEWGRPEFRIATYELLIGLFGVALAEDLEERAGWRRLFETPPSREVLAEKLAPLEPYFDLDGNGPRFLQDFEAIEGEARRLDALLIDAPGDNTLKNGADIFNKRDRFPVFSRKAAAAALYAMQAFAPSGGAGHRTSMRGGGPLTTLVVPEGATLWRRIVANLPWLREPEDFPPEDRSLVFPWLKPTRLSTEGRTTEVGAQAHRLQCYFGMPRRIRLIFAPNAARTACAITGEIDEVVATGFVTAPWGVSYGAWIHPLSPYYQVKPGDPASPRLPIHAQSGRIGYRDWAAYLFCRGNPDLRARQVVQFEDVFRQRGARLQAAGFVTDNMKCLDWADGEAPLYLLRNARAQERLAELAQDILVPAASMAVSALRGALREALGVDDAQKTLIASALERFWIETESEFFDLLDRARRRLDAIAADASEQAARNVGLSDLNQDWLSAMRCVALRIFDETAPLERLGDLDAATIKRVVTAAKSLRLALYGRGKFGADLFQKLGLPPPQRASANSSQTGATP